MTTFEIGKKYYDTSACDHNCVFVIEIVKRTAKTVTFRRDGQERRAKIYTDRDGEYIIPERYSMAPVFRASREYVEAPAEEAPAAPDPVSAFIPSGARPAQRPDVVMVGQPVVGNWGAMCPSEVGVIVGFAEREATRWSAAATVAAIRWEGGRLDYRDLNDIHPAGWRSASGSPLGVFFAR
uniref:Uncharacterized protein n=1 Tax=Dulem virus 34 TaxID=3145752 RepID=A0AAU8B7B2_9CAUD